MLRPNKSQTLAQAYPLLWTPGLRSPDLNRSPRTQRRKRRQAADRQADEQTHKYILSTDGLVTHKGGGDVEETCNKEPSICAHTKYRKVRLQRDNSSLGDSQETYHRRSVSSSVQDNTPKVRRRVMDSPLASVVPLSCLLSSFSSLHITKGTCSPWQRVKSATAPASVYDRSQ